MGMVEMVRMAGMADGMVNRMVKWWEWLNGGTDRMVEWREWWECLAE